MNASIDSLVDQVQAVLTRYPDADWASVVIHRPDVPNVVLVVTPDEVTPPAMRQEA